ncbi:MAG: amino-acid N-acetyltransferase [Paludibacterium sp.]|uniref:amino-acid N-acetyltransferase n=1 Tax=Paludibacterium sp. TaxID=1917523 RepID=UPI002600328D|nr:amino-acid N-acetyltransferase [Paludibacterium sp.]MBV8046373.1 amino-acid N-acetyltransferase [Paludibacterium sp.]MBV8646270.1 amino-acid N-acetyltransferase [Paludibacterium sp.]
MLSHQFALPFREAAPYINTFRGKTFVLAVSGETIDNGHFPRLAPDINLLVSLGVRVVLVHGIRPQIDKLLAPHGLARQFHHHRRITDDDTIDIVKQAIGLARLDIESALSAGMPNSPMHGAHLRVVGGNVMTAQPLGVVDGVDMQYTGQVRRLDTQAIHSWLANGDLVLISPIGYSPTGEAFNLTMEEVATETAIALRAEKLIFLIEGIGVLDEDGDLIHNMTAQQAEERMAAGLVNEEAQLYLPYTVRATREGVTRAHLVSDSDDGALLTELFTSTGSGSMIARDPLVKLRPANIDDIGDLMALIRPLEEQNILVRRSREWLEMEIGRYTVLEHDNRIYGCVAMHPFHEAESAELACLAVAPERRNSGFGELLLRHVEYQARTQGLASLFVLTTKTAHWFIERGFSEMAPSELPEERQRLYNTQRRSKVFAKPL